jgi:hypothetical protein
MQIFRCPGKMAQGLTALFNVRVGIIKLPMGDALLARRGVLEMLENVVTSLTSSFQLDPRPS